LNKKTKYKAVDIMYHLNRKQISARKDPMGIAATALYIACLNTGEKRTQTDIETRSRNNRSNIEKQI
jgi:transcription initiation factor TFIIB